MIWEYIQGWSDVAVIVRLIIATAFGCIIGSERVQKGHNAGIRTFTLVTLGAAIATVLNIKLYDISGISADAGRIPAAVISGVGFLGAGCIMVTGRSHIKGLTTAATLWASAVMGMVVGAGFLTIGISCLVLIMLTNRILENATHRIEQRNTTISLYIEVEKEKGVVKLRNYIQSTPYELITMNKSKEKTLLSSDVGISLGLDLKKNKLHQDVLNEFNNLEYVNYIEEVR